MKDAAKLSTTNPWPRREVSTGGIYTKRGACMVHDGGRVNMETTGRGAKHLYKCIYTIMYMRRLECAVCDKLLQSCTYLMVPGNQW